MTSFSFSSVSGLTRRSLLLASLALQLADLPAGRVDALRQVGEVRLRLLEERAKALDFTLQRGHLLAQL